MSLTKDGRPLTNVEMSADLEEWKRVKRERIDKHGCCGETEKRGASGECFGVGICPAVIAAYQMMGDQRYGRPKRTGSD